MSAYATASDYAAQYGDDDATDDDVLTCLLAQASDAIDMAFRARGREVPSARLGDALLLRCARRVACQLAKRELDAQDSDWPADMTQTSMTAGSYSQSFTFGSSGGGNLRLNGADLAALGLAGGAAAFGGGA